MELKDISFPKPYENILFDEVLLDDVKECDGGGFLRFWESPIVFIVLGITGKTEEDVHLKRAQKDRIPILRRSSGGGTVLQGPGCLNYALVLSQKEYPKLHDLRQSYQWISGKILEALQRIGVRAYFRPPSDLAIGESERKFSGNAQRRKRHGILHHGTILYNFDLDLIDRYLNMPSQIPEYRRCRSHADFLTNISLDISLFKSRLADIFDAKHQGTSAQELLQLREKICHSTML